MWLWLWLWLEAGRTSGDAAAMARSVVREEVRRAAGAAAGAEEVAGAEAEADSTVDVVGARAGPRLVSFERTDVSRRSGVRGRSDGCDDRCKGACACACVCPVVGDAEVDGGCDARECVCTRLLGSCSCAVVKPVSGSTGPPTDLLSSSVPCGGGGLLPAGAKARAATAGGGTAAATGLVLVAADAGTEADPEPHFVKEENNVATPVPPAVVAGLGAFSLALSCSVDAGSGGETAFALSNGTSRTPCWG